MPISSAVPGPLRDARGPLLDVSAVGLCVAVMYVDLAWTEQAEVTVVAGIAIVAASLPVLLRRRAPGWAFTLAMALIFGVLSFAGIYNTVAFPAVICAYTLASSRGRRAALPAALAALPVVVLMMQIYSPHSFLAWDTVKNLGFVALPLALGMAAHDRRAYTRALVDRAESAERTREEEALRRVGEERLRIARDVHDVVAHAMVAINVQAGVGAFLLDRDLEQARSTMRDIKRVSGEALDDLRAILMLLRQENLDVPESTVPVGPTKGIVEIEELREGLSAAGVDLDVDLDPAIDTLPAVVGATGYRIVQEALTNVMRHVGPTSARLRVTRRAESVMIEVENDRGHGCRKLDGTGSGNGLRGMRERAAAVGGSLEAGPRADGGWRVAASLPMSVS